VKIGSESADEPLVLGNQNMAALAALVAVFAQNAPTGCLIAPVGGAFALHPKLLAGLAQWAAKYIPKTVSLTKFTER
jgi:hypothetical protein